MQIAKKQQQTTQAMSILALAKTYFASQFTRHPSRYIEIVHVLHKYQLLRVAAHLGLPHAHADEHVATSDKTSGLYDGYGECLAQALEELGTCFIKLGQVMSTRPDLLPPSYITALARLQDHITTVPIEAITNIIERELGAPLTELFQSFDTKPLATASVAQVHRATLPDGTLVVVKVQRPGVQKQVERDIEVMQEVARFTTRYTPFGSQYRLPQMVQEIKQSLSQELDFQQEADSTRLISQNISEFQRLVTPKVYPDYSSSQVLTLEFLHGRHLEQIPPAELHSLNTQAIAQELLSAYLKQMVVDGIFHCDPHPGNILLTHDGHLALLDFGMVGRFDADQKEQVLLLLLSFAERQGERVADIYLHMVGVPETCDRQAFTQEVCMLISRYHDMSKGHLEVGKVLLGLVAVAQAYQMTVPAQLTLLGKAMLNLDGALSVLAPNLNPVQIIRNYTQQMMQQRAIAHMSLGRAYTWFLDTRHLLDNLPRRTDAILDKLANNQLTVHLKVDQLNEAAQRVARGVSFGMIVSSLLISVGLWLTSKRKKE